MSGRWRLLSVALLGAATLAAAQPRAPERASLETLLTRAAWYLDYFVDQVENVVAEESYIQDATVVLPSFNTAAGRGAVTPQTSAAEMSRARHRDLRSDFLLVKSPGSADLLAFRDLLVLDGAAVRDHEQS